jgi:hypothetical protein
MPNQTNPSFLPDPPIHPTFNLETAHHLQKINSIEHVLKWQQDDWENKNTNSISTW